MKKFFLCEIYRNTDRFNASIAYKHVEFFLKEKNYLPIYLLYINSTFLFFKICRIIHIFLLYLHISKRSIVVLHFPLLPKAFRLLFKALNKKKVYTVAIIHDINGLRINNSTLLKVELKILNNFSHIIAHNTAMKDYLFNQGIVKPITVLNLFDYKSNVYFKNRSFKKTLIIAANLQKAEFIKLLPEWLNKHNDFIINIYGQTKDLSESLLNVERLLFKGPEEPEILPDVMEGNFGMVWDGTSLATCKGNYGDYMRFNTPHKISVFLAAGIPVIVWKESAIADFIKQYNLGFITSSWDEAAEIINIMDQHEYYKLSKNAFDMGLKIRSGFFLNQALNEVESTII